ncbi:MAG TPA: LysM peptidoglycan-binding domain-containing M23 family metallopeptidase [Ktedonobacterales bacterium]
MSRRRARRADQSGDQRTDKGTARRTAVPRPASAPGGAANAPANAAEDLYATHRFAAMPVSTPRASLPDSPRDALPMVLDDTAGPPAILDDAQTRPVVIPGSGRVVSTFVGRLPRRPRPLAQRLAVVVLAVCIVGSALFGVAPAALGGADAQQASPLQALSGAVVWRSGPGYFWYIAQNSDTLEGLAKRFKCQVGGIYELNGLLSGQELQEGKAYKIPTDPNYGMYYEPPSYVVKGGQYGTTVYAPTIWGSLAGLPPRGALCAPTPRGSGDNMGNYDLSSFDLKAPNWGAYWMRGFTWYHFGVDLDNPEGTPIHAAQAGEVIFAAWDTGGGGWSVKINNCNHLATAYGHMEKLLVKVHDMVHVGDVIGLEGSTGWSTGPHLHFSVQWDNLAVDPMLFFNESKYDITHFIPDGP